MQVAFNTETELNTGAVEEDTSVCRLVSSAGRAPVSRPEC